MSKVIKVQDMLLKRNPEKYKDIQKRNKQGSKKDEGNKKLKSVISDLEMENGRLEKEIKELNETVIAQDKEIESLKKENEKLEGVVKELQDELKEG